MFDVPQLVEQFRSLVQQHVPAETIPPAVPTAAVCLAAGVLVSVLGAKLARFGVIAVFALGGVALGCLFAGRQHELPAVVVAMIGGLIGGVMGFGFYRVWVGLVTAGLLAAAGLGLVAGQQALPHVAEYEQWYDSRASVAPRTFVVPPRAPQTDQRSQRMREWVHATAKRAGEFWNFVRRREADVDRNAILLGAGGAAFGLMLGLFVPRLTVIVGTALLGTVLVSGGLGVLSSRLLPDVYRAGMQSPAAMAVVTGGFFLASVILQALLTRREAPRPPRLKVSPAAG